MQNFYFEKQRVIFKWRGFELAQHFLHNSELSPQQHQELVQAYMREYRGKDTIQQKQFEFYDCLSYPQMKTLIVQMWVINATSIRDTNITSVGRSPHKTTLQGNIQDTSN